MVALGRITKGSTSNRLAFLEAFLELLSVAAG
jgi:hypothetical protein